MNEKMEYCIEEIRKYSDGVHELKKGIGKEKIKIFEKKTGIVLPDDYMEFLTIYNGGEIFIPGTSIAGIYDEEMKKRKIWLTIMEKINELIKALDYILIKL